MSEYSDKNWGSDLDQDEGEDEDEIDLIDLSGLTLVDSLTTRPPALYDFRRSDLADLLKAAVDKTGYNETIFGDDNWGDAFTGKALDPNDSQWYFNGPTVRASTFYAPRGTRCG